MTLPEVSYIDINLVKIKEGRQRREVNVDDLKRSIERRGLLQFPVVQEGSYELRAGERRLTACRELGWTRIPVRWFSNLDPIEAELVELEENVRREALPWQDLVRATARIHNLYVERDSKWEPKDTAEAMDVSKGHLSLCRRVAAALGEERIAKCDSMREAYNILLRRDQRNNSDMLDEMLGLDDGPLPDPEAEALAELTDPSPATSDERPASDGSDPDTQLAPAAVPRSAPVLNRAAPIDAPIRCASFMDWLDSDAPEQLPRRFNLIHCDFPYGINLFNSKQGRGSEPTDGYEDTPEVYFELLEAFCKNLDRFCADSAHLVFWFSGKHRAATMKMFRDHAPSFQFYPYDLIWHKSDNMGIAGDHRRHPRHVHETALFGVRNKRQILEIVGDSISAPTAKTMHPSTKPIPVLTHFFRMFVDENTRMFDPTCGSGTSLRAADAAGAASVFGLEIDPEAARVGLREFNEARSMRRLSKAVA